jgi:dissimilatory sulfite reductase (desulfoviridin) alpha/beta subunit
MYIAYDYEDWDFTKCETEEEAIKEVEKIIDYYRDNANDEGWPDNLHKKIGYAKIEKDVVEEKIIADYKDFTDEEWEEEGYSLNHNKIVDYKIKEAK